MSSPGSTARLPHPHRLPAWLLALAVALACAVLLAVAPVAAAPMDFGGEPAAELNEPAPVEVAVAEPLDIDTDSADREGAFGVEQALPPAPLSPLVAAVPHGRPQATPPPPQRPPRALA